MHKLSLITFALSAALVAPAALAQITFYEHDGFRGRVISSAAPMQNFRDQKFNDRASSVVVERGRWEVCQDNDFGGSCVVLRPGRYASLGDMGLNDRISSARPAPRGRPDTAEAPQPQAPVALYEYRRRPNERIFDAPVTAVHAVVGAATERCWIEREQVSTRGETPPGRVAGGAVLGGVIGYQSGNATPVRDVRRCESVPSTVPTYWNVGYRFRGVDHQMQMDSQPGRTVTVNARGEPRM